MDQLELEGTLVNEQLAQYCVLLSRACDMTCMSSKHLYTICDYLIAFVFAEPVSMTGLD
jgi:hypothetical protein